jgi:hypothetical protein
MKFLVENVFLLLPLPSSYRPSYIFSLVNTIPVSGTLSISQKTAYESVFVRRS